MDTVSIVIPAYNEGASIGPLVSELRASADWHEVIVVDDGSSDDTGAKATAAGARVIRHPYNKGNGAAVKTAVRHATGRFVLIVDADGQHRPSDAARLVAHLDTYDLVVGARSAATQASLARRAGNALLNWVASYLTEQNIPDLTSGFRAVRRECLVEFLHLLPNGFSTPTTTTLAFMRAGYNVAFEPVDALQRTGRSKIRLTQDGAGFLLILLKIVTIFSPLRIFVTVSMASLALGALYGLWNVFVSGRIPNGAVVLILFAALVLLVGLVSEQIAALRFAGPVSDRRD